MQKQLNDEAQKVGKKKKPNSNQADNKNYNNQRRNQFHRSKDKSLKIIKVKASSLRK